MADLEILRPEVRGAFAICQTQLPDHDSDGTPNAWYYVRAELLRLADENARLQDQKAVPMVTRESAINALAHVGQHNGPGRETEARQMLVEVSPSAAHSAQAQPPAASVPDAMVNAAMLAYNVECHSQGDATNARADGMRAALEAALTTQENHLI